ncbi:MAG: hypothetical protein KGN35_07855 [Betaproteobacteria bacterium]|nr:hypothetical protein [Betaproteobacteria bacterium]
MKTYLTYQTTSSIPLAAVMTGLVVIGSMPNDTGRVMSLPIRQVTDEIRPSYLLGNAGMTIRLQMAITGDTVVDNYRPRTELGRKLLALRRAYVTSGGQLLDGDALDVEVRSRRGGVVDV